MKQRKSGDEMKSRPAMTSKVRRSPMEHPRHQYPEETRALQEIVQGCGLVEKIKWGKPCFTLHEKNVVLIQRFNEYIALLFFKGVLLKDPENLLCRISDNMDVPRQLRFRTVAEITRLRSVIIAYVGEAIELQESGARAQLRPAKLLAMPDELQMRLQASAPLKKAFASLTPGRQKGYIFYISSGKQSSTRMARVDKNVARILASKGLTDR